MKPSPLRPIGRAIVRIPQTYPHVYVAREPITEPIIQLDTEPARPIPVKAVKKFVKRVPEPAPAFIPAPKKMMKKIGQANTPVLDLLRLLLAHPEVDLIRTEQAQGQTGEAVPIERGNRFMDMFQMAGGIPTSQYLNLSELPGLATSTPELATTIRALPEGLVITEKEAKRREIDRLVQEIAKEAREGKPNGHEEDYVGESYDYTRIRWLTYIQPLAQRYAYKYLPESERELFTTNLYDVIESGLDDYANSPEAKAKYEAEEDRLNKEAIQEIGDVLMLYWLGRPPNDIDSFFNGMTYAEAIDTAKRYSKIDNAPSRIRELLPGVIQTIVNTIKTEGTRHKRGYRMTAKTSEQLLIMIRSALVKRVPEPAPAVIPAPKKMMKKIGQANTPVLDLIQAEQAQGQTGEAVPIERGNRFMDMFQMAGGIPTSQYLNLSELPGLATSTPELATTIRALPEGLVKPSTQIADLLPPLLKQLKVGDIVYKTRRVDTDDNTRPAYNTTTTAVVKSIAKDHTSFMILPYKRNGKEFEKSAKRVTLETRSWKGVTLTDDWSIDDSRYSGLYRTIEERDRYDPPLKKALEQEALQKKQQEYEAEASKLRRALDASPEEKEAQYATLTKRQLLDLYEVWSNRTGRRITNIKTAPVKKILEVFKQFNI